MTNEENFLVTHSASNSESGTRPAQAGANRELKSPYIIRAREIETFHGAFELAREKPLFSASLGLIPAQRIALAALLGAIIIAAIIDISVLMQIGRILLLSVFIFAICFRILLLAIHFWPKSHKSGNDEPSSNLDIWPIYTVLLPMYREAKMLPQLAEAISRLKYPQDRLDIKLLLEADDEETLAVARKLKLGRNWQIIIVPDIGPRTKPKALNIGLARAKGSFVTIYDAEDRPHPDQLRAAVKAFDEAGNKLACVQAPLGYYNAAHNWLTRQFSLEYNAHFNVILPALVRLGIAFPLGGTSNHFRRKALIETRGWDPFNVTEDADLGFRLAQNGWHAAMIEPPTLEEATAHVLPWIGQRSRWIKGFVQTLMVHLRGGMPGGCLTHAFGFIAVLGMAVFSAFSHGFLLLATLICFACWPIIGPMLSTTDIVLAITGVSITWALLLAGQLATRNDLNPIAIISSVFYWPLQTIAALRAARELLNKPFHWEKTEHGHSIFAAIKAKSLDRRP